MNSEREGGEATWRRPAGREVRRARAAGASALKVGGRQDRGEQVFSAGKKLP